jgi:prepilin signal peptidase PulO-like enzyme (type II secretory pathway)
MQQNKKLHSTLQTLAAVAAKKPFISVPPAMFNTCSRCFYINNIANNFCTNCGYPMGDDTTITLYHIRLKQKKELLHKSEKAIQTARTILYLLAAICLTGVAILFSPLNNRYAIAILATILAAVFFTLAHYSLLKPFTALIGGFIIVLTLSTIAVFGEFTSAFTTVEGVYGIAASMLVIFFLLRGIQASYKADLLNEEMNIH